VTLALAIAALVLAGTAFALVVAPRLGRASAGYPPASEGSMVVVHIEEGLHYRGHEAFATPWEVVLDGAVLVNPGDGTETPADGRVRIPRIRVELVQEVGRAEEGMGTKGTWGG
jgi:hypothetical protein